MRGIRIPVGTVAIPAVPRILSISAEYLAARSRMHDWLWRVGAGRARSDHLHELSRAHPYHHDQAHRGAGHHVELAGTGGLPEDGTCARSMPFHTQARPPADA